MDHTKGLALKVSFLTRMKIETTLDSLFDSVTLALDNLENEVNDILFGRPHGGHVI